ncbi:MAG: HEAT repeat domain-containing protein [Opitutaceae bacterium]|jgi:hypothetical protein
MHLLPARSRITRAVRALFLRLLVLFSCGLTIPAIQADPFPSPQPAPPADLTTLQISATPERTTYLLGETVRVRYAVANHGTETITVRRDNDTAFWRPDSLQVVAFEAVTGAPVPAAPSGMDMLNYRYGRRHSIAPGKTWSHDFFILRHVELPGPGRYRFQLRHTLGWPDQSTAPAAPEFTLEFAAPTPDQADALVAAAPPLGSPEDDTPRPVDTFGFNYSVYIVPLVKRIAAGEPALLDSLDRMATPEATAALIELSTNPHGSVAKAARHKILYRLPPQGAITVYSGDVWPWFPGRKNRQDAAWTSAEFTSARALACTLLQEELPPLDASGFINTWDSSVFIAAAILARLGEASDLADLAQGLQTAAYARTLDATAYRNRVWAFSGNEIDGLRTAYAGMHARGIRIRPTSTQLGEAILAFDDARLSTRPAGVTLFSDDFRNSVRTIGPRSPAWLDQLNLIANLLPWPADPSSGERPGYLGDPTAHRPPHPMLLIAALESIPAPLPPECVPFVDYTLESNVPHVIHAACAVAVETRSPVFVPALLHVLRTESNPHVRATVAKAVAQLGDRRAALRALADDLATTPEPEQLLRTLADILFGKNQPAINYNIPMLSRTERLALGESWQTFLRENETRLAQEPGLAPGDAIIPKILFAGSIAWRLPQGQLWPEHAE